MSGIRLVINKWLLAPGDEMQIIAELENGQNLNANEVVFSTDEERIATIDKNGVLKALSRGWVQVSATYEADGAARTATVMLTIADTKLLPLLKKRHPRILLTEEVIIKVKHNINNDSRVSKWYKSLKEKAEKELIDVGLNYEEHVTGGDTNSPYNFANKIATWSFIYIVDKEERYLQKTINALLNACEDFPDWGDRGLYLGLMSFAVAIGYDWLYDFMDESQRNRIRKGITEKGIARMLQGYRYNHYYRTEQRGGIGTYVKANTNQNCIPSAGLGMSALAIGDEEPELCEEMLQNTLLSLTLYLDALAPEGAYMEGLLYWFFGMGVTGIFINSLVTSLETDLGLWDYPGVSLTGYFPMYMLSSTGLQFNYGDSNVEFLRDDRGGADVLFELAKAYNNPDFMWFNSLLADTEPRVWAIIGYDPAKYKSLDKLKLSKDRIFKGDCQVGSFRSKWTESIQNDGIYLGFKGGKGRLNHGDMDTGTFVLDALGERWAWELGRDVPYPKHGFYWNLRPGDQRWNFYKKRAEGHNTLIINPDGTDGQDIRKLAEIIHYESTEAEACAIVDMTPAYAIYGAEKVHRTFKLTDNRSKVIIEDAVHTCKPSEVWWFMHTKAQIDIDQESKSVALSIGKKRMRMEIKGAEKAQICSMKAERLPNSPCTKHYEESREEFCKLAIHFEGVTDIKLSVMFTPEK